MARVLIEFYSGKTPENLISILNERFDGVFFLYSEQKCAPSPRRTDALSRQVQKLFGFPAEFCRIEDLDLETALNALNGIWKKENEYLLDITGGDEAFIAAAGIFSQQHGNVTLHQYDVLSGKKLFSYPAQKDAVPLFPHYVSVPELLSLNGTAPLSAPSHIFTRGPLKEEILRLWNAVRSRPKDWNRYCALSDDKEGALHSLTQKIVDPGAALSAYEAISERLKKAGILSDERRTERKGRSFMEFSLNVSDEARFLYDKAGNLLEMYCALCAHESKLFHDIRVGVMLDWNGRIDGVHTPDPRNEVDLILMQENLPILVSCKNTAPQNEYLYEIMIMAKHYGGFYATPALFASGKATQTVRKRAEEMGIVLIDGIRFKSPEQMVALLHKIFDKQKRTNH